VTSSGTPLSERTQSGTKLIGTKLIGILALQGAVSEHADMLSALGADTRLVRRPEHLDGLDGLVIPGGESTAIARLAAPMGLLPAIRSRIDAGLAVLGTCAGLILLADKVTEPGALADFDRVGGLDVTVRRNGYGGQLASFEAEVDIVAESDAVGGVSDPGSSAGSNDSTGAHTTMNVAFIRAPIIDHVGGHATVVATHNGAPVAVRQDRIIGATFHPEITGDLTLHRAFLALLP